MLKNVNKTKFVFISLEIHNGEFDYHSRSVHEMGKRKSIEKFAKLYAKHFYGTKSVLYNERYEFFGGSIIVEISDFSEITKEQYNVLNTYLSK